MWHSDYTLDMIMQVIVVTNWTAGAADTEHHCKILQHADVGECSGSTQEKKPIRLEACVGGLH
jgi:hypothetical protein